MRIFKYRLFARWMQQENISDDALKTAAEAMMAGLFDANLGSGVYKKRLAKKGKGKRGAYRIILAFRQKERIFFMYAFSKKHKQNISAKEKEVYKNLSKIYLNASDEIIETLILLKEITEIR